MISSTLYLNLQCAASPWHSSLSRENLLLGSTKRGGGSQPERLFLLERLCDLLLLATSPAWTTTAVSSEGIMKAISYNTTVTVITSIALPLSGLLLGCASRFWSRYNPSCEIKQSLDEGCVLVNPLTSVPSDNLMLGVHNDCYCILFAVMYALMHKYCHCNFHCISYCLIFSLSCWFSLTKTSSLSLHRRCFIWQILCSSYSATSSSCTAAILCLSSLFSATSALCTSSLA